MRQPSTLDSCMREMAWTERSAAPIVLLNRSRVSASQRNAVSVGARRSQRSEEHTSELQSLMRISYAVFCLKKNTLTHTQHLTNSHHYTHILSYTLSIDTKHTTTTHTATRNRAHYQHTDASSYTTH